MVFLRLFGGARLERDGALVTGRPTHRHPLALLRHQAPFSQCQTARELRQLPHGRFVRLAGLVTNRQRPGTASGVLFMTLEDETGNSNVVVWRDLQDRYRQVLLASPLILLKGTLEKTAEGIVHVIAGHLEDASDHMAQLTVPSRDFH